MSTPRIISFDDLSDALGVSLDDIPFPVDSASVEAGACIARRAPVSPRQPSAEGSENAR
jgi:hypothetical protein